MCFERLNQRDRHAHQPLDDEVRGPFELDRLRREEPVRADAERRDEAAESAQERELEPLRT